MRIAWLLCVMSIASCGKDVAAVADAPPPDGGAATMMVSGPITASATWSGAIDLAGPTEIQAGVTITVAAGTTITARTGSSIAIAGTLDVEGTSAAHVVMKPAASNWAGLTVSGSLVMHYAEEISGGIVVTGGTITVMDTRMAHFNNLQDYLIINGGMVDVEYSSIVPQDGSGDKVHCDMHANSGHSQNVKVFHTDLSGALYGLDLFGGSADLTYDNWFTNQDDLYTEIGYPVTADVSFGWFQAGAPVAAQGSSITATDLSPTKRTDTGPRP